MTTIQWYPGHMNKAKNQLEDSLDLIDVSIEVLDAHLPAPPRNSMIGQLTKKKPHIIILNKSDLVDPIQTKKQIRCLQGEGNFAISMDAQHNTNMTNLFKITKLTGKKKTEKLIAKGAFNLMIRAAIAGIPNCGKSMIINRTVGRNATTVGDKPGVARGQSWLKIKTNVQILGTPGILWPKSSDQEAGYKLAACSTIKADAFHSDDVALSVIELLKQDYKKDLTKFAQVTNEELENMSNPDLLLAMANKYGMWDDYDKSSLFMLQRLRKGKLGRITFNLR